MCLVPTTYLIGVSQSSALGIAVDPHKLIFSEKDRTKPITLINPTDEPVTYRISFQEMQMTDQGGLELVDESLIDDDYPDSSSMMRYSPRQVVIPPKQAQIVRFMVRKPPGLESGEYRSHILFRALPKEEKNALVENQKEGMSISVSPIYNVSIPLIVRHGNLEAGIELKDIKVQTLNQQGPTRLKLKMYQKGERSISGKLTALFKPRGSNKSIVIGSVKNVTIYNIDYRHINVPLDETGQNLLETQSGEITVKFEENNVKGQGFVAETSASFHGV